MKKSVIVLTAIIGAGLLVFSGCCNGDTFTEKTYSSGETTVNSVLYYFKNGRNIKNDSCF